MVLTSPNHAGSFQPMSLIYARRTGNLVYFLADTFSEEGITGISYNWFSEPILKIFRRTDVVVAFSGNSHLAQKCILSFSGEKLEDAISALCQSSASSAVDYAICHIPTNRLFFIENGKSDERDNGYLGSISGFEIFQKEKLEPSQLEQTYMHIHQYVDDVEATANEDCASNLQAFKAALINSDRTFGGIAILYVVANSKSKFGTYASVYRGPLIESEMPLSGSSAMAFQDVHRGGYQVAVWGSATSLAIYFPDNGPGHIFQCIQNVCIEPRTFQQVDGYDFNDEAIAAGCGNEGISTWQNWRTAFRNAMKHLNLKKFDIVERRIDDIKETITNMLRGRNPDKEINIGSNFLESLHSCGKLVIPFDMANCITAHFELKINYFEAVNNTLKRDLTYRQYVTWNALLGDLTFAVDFNW